MMFMVADLCLERVLQCLVFPSPVRSEWHSCHQHDLCIQTEVSTAMSYELFTSFTLIKNMQIWYFCKLTHKSLSQLCWTDSCLSQNLWWQAFSYVWLFFTDVVISLFLAQEMTSLCLIRLAELCSLSLQQEETPVSQPLRSTVILVKWPQLDLLISCFLNTYMISRSTSPELFESG